jgi:hypothetical protein
VLVADLMSIVALYPGEKVVLAGHSMGGYERWFGLVWFGLFGFSFLFFVLDWAFDLILDLVLCLVSDLFPPRLTPSAIVARAASTMTKLELALVVVVDVVEGTAMEALPRMDELLAKIPKKFRDIPEAISWAYATR